MLSRSYVKEGVASHDQLDPGVCLTCLTEASKASRSLLCTCTSSRLSRGKGEASVRWRCDSPTEVG